MLGKLIKYEIKATGRSLLPLFLALLMFAGIIRFISPLGPEKFNTPAIISMTVYIMIMAGMFVMTFMVMIQRFYKNLLWDEGYLMFTLPVKPWKHIVSKLLVSMIWIAASVIVAMISILIIAYQKGMITEFLKGFSTLLRQMNEQLGASVYLYAFEALIGFLISLTSAILIIYASMAIGHLFSKHKILASFGAFIVLNTLTQILLYLPPEIASLFNIHFSVDIADKRWAIQLVILYGILFTGLLSAAYFTVTNFILSKRLNLE